jgi:hypothetical protein
VRVAELHPAGEGNEGPVLPSLVGLELLHAVEDLLVVRGLELQKLYVMTSHVGARPRDPGASAQPT